MNIATYSILHWSPVTFLEDMIHCYGFAIWNYKNSFLIHLEIPEITEDHFQVHPIFLPNKLNRLVAIVLLEWRPFFFSEFILLFHFLIEMFHQELYTYTA